MATTDRRMTEGLSAMAGVLAAGMAWKLAVVEGADAVQRGMIAGGLLAVMAGVALAALMRLLGSSRDHATGGRHLIHFAATAIIAIPIVIAAASLA